MRSLFIIASIVTLSAGATVLTATHPVIITGHLRNKTGTDKQLIELASVFVKGNNKILGKAVTDKKGNFTLTFTPKKEKSFDFYYYNIGEDTLLIDSMTSFESDTPEITFYVPGKYQENTFGKVICKICRQSDKTYKIKYSEAPITSFYISETNDTVRNLIYKGKYQEDCISGLATYWCDRDQVKF